MTFQKFYKLWISTSACFRDQLAATPGPPVRGAFADLGVLQHTQRSRDSSLADLRELKALGKLERIQVVRLNFSWKCRLVCGIVPRSTDLVEAQEAAEQGNLGPLRSACRSAVGPMAQRSTEATRLPARRAGPSVRGWRESYVP